MRVGQCTIELVSPFACLQIIIPVTVLSALDVPCQLVGALVEFGANVRWEVDRFIALIVATFDVIGTLWFLFWTVGILLNDAFEFVGTELLTGWARLLRSDTFMAVDVIGTRLGDDSLGVTGRRAHDGAHWAVWE